MGQFSRAELESAFQAYLKGAAEARTDWSAWADRFTEDALYVEHSFGRFLGREAIREWITGTMGAMPPMKFPVAWHVIDEERGWVVFQSWNQLPDPQGGEYGERYQFAAWSLIKYAGNNLWSYQEDMYNPMESQAVVQSWIEAKSKAS